MLNDCARALPFNTHTHTNDVALIAGIGWLAFCEPFATVAGTVARHVAPLSLSSLRACVRATGTQVCANAAAAAAAATPKASFADQFAVVQFLFHKTTLAAAAAVRLMLLLPLLRPMQH